MPLTSIIVGNLCVCLAQVFSPVSHQKLVAHVGENAFVLFVKQGYVFQGTSPVRNISAFSECGGRHLPRLFMHSATFYLFVCFLFFFPIVDLCLRPIFLALPVV